MTFLFFILFQYQFTFSNFYLDFYFPFSIWTFVSLFYLDLYFFFGLLFLFRLLFPFQTFIRFLDFYFFFGLLFSFLHKSRSDLGFLPSFILKMKIHLEQIKTNEKLHGKKISIGRLKIRENM